MSTTLAKLETTQRKWYVIDAAGKPLGRTAVIAANLLRGKHKVDFTPNVDCGDCVIVINSDKGVASEELITEVAKHIEENRPVGAKVTVESASPLALNISVNLVLSEGISKETAEERIVESITSYLQKNAFASTYISYAQIGGCILDCDGIADYSDLTINNGTDNIDVGETEVPVLGVITVA